MRFPILFITAIFLLSGCVANPPPVAAPTCKPPIGLTKLYVELAKNPMFAGGIPPPGKVMRIDSNACGYTISLGRDSPDEIGNTEIQVDGLGHVLSVQAGY
jgi:starvation-inducible outer membrane lipoprotein